MSDIATEDKGASGSGGRSWGRMMGYAFRVVWIAVRLAAVLVLIRQGGAFFYQGF